MLARIRKAMKDNEEGFTLIELLVVMIIIGILAAISIPLFLSQKSKAYETSLKSDLTNIATNIATAQVDNPGTICVKADTGVATVQDQQATGGTCPLTTAENSYAVALSGGNAIDTATVDMSTGAYCVSETHTGGGKEWAVYSDGTTGQQLGAGDCSGTSFNSGG